MALPVGTVGLSLMSPHVGELASRRPSAPDLGEEPKALNFESLLTQTLGEANHALHVADQKTQEFAAGQSDDIHGTMIAVSQADIELRLVGTLRNKVVDAFYELWRMQI